MWLKITGLALSLAAAIAVGAWRYVERPRVIEGVWLHMFEGSDFFERRSPGRECELYRDSERAGWLDYSLAAVDPRYGREHPLPSTGTYRSKHGVWPLDAFEVRFEGRKRLTPWGGGHMGLWKSEYEVNRMLFVKPIPALTCDVD
ncbi:hypothetical protein [Brevundimonas faecalis]|uniref:DUF2850 domain-containing protein n=1 Tax=Brevundimonas faecalis TaxID=947378 RepID=A0ABV2R768_9CAUL